eukprot:scaffold820_cov376-Prasinococcus_capsulatus_cf.AAC.7
MSHSPTRSAWRGGCSSAAFASAAGLVDDGAAASPSAFTSPSSAGALACSAGPSTFVVTTQSLQSEANLHKGSRRGHELPLRDGGGGERRTVGQVLWLHDCVGEALPHEQAAHAGALDGHLHGRGAHHLGHFVHAEGQFHNLAVLGRVYGQRALLHRRMLLQPTLQSIHLVGLAVHEHDVRGMSLLDEVLRLREVCVRREGDALDRHAQRHLGAGSRGDLCRRGQNLPRQRALHSEVGNDDSVAPVLAPGLEQLARQARLQHGRSGQHHAGAHIIELTGALQVLHVLEHEGVGHLEGRADLFGHHVDRPSRQRAGLVDGHVAQFGHALPALVQDQQQLLSPAQGHHRQQHLAASAQHADDHVEEATLAFLPRPMRLHAVRAFHDHHVRGLVGQLRARQVAVGLARVVAGVENTHARDLHLEHRGAEHVACHVGLDEDAIQVDLLVEVDHFDAVHAELQVLVSVESVCGAVLGHLDEVREEHLVHCFGGVRHEDAPAELGLGDHVRQGCAVVQVEVRDKDHIDLLQLHLHTTASTDGAQEPVTSSRKGSEARPESPGWMPQSNITFLPLYRAMTHDRPTSEPAPSGISSSASASCCACPCAST